MNEFNILITQVNIKSIQFNFNEEKKKYTWDVNACLCTDDGRKVTSISMSSDHWDESTTIKFPETLSPLVRRFFETAKPILADKIMNRFIAIESPKENEVSF